MTYTQIEYGTQHSADLYVLAIVIGLLLSLVAVFGA